MGSEMCIRDSGYTVKYTNDAVVFIERSIDILAPAISGEKVLILKSNYRSIDNRNKFLSLINELEALEMKTNKMLPEFRPI